MLATGCSNGNGDGVGGATSASGVGGAGGAPSRPDGEVSVPTRDGVALRTWIYLPPGDGPFPMLVVRNPYASLNDDASLRPYAQYFLDRGIGLVWQAVRGTGGSGGTFVPYVSEVADSADTIAWLAGKPWSNGRFASGGGSYLGYTAWASAVADPRVVVVLSDDTAADEEMTRHGGVVDGYLLSWWSYVERARFANDAEESDLTNGLDASSADEAVLGRDVPYWNDLLKAGLGVYPSDASLRALAKNVCVPALHIIEGSTGWRDPVETWEAIQKDGCAAERDHQWLLVAPESHAFHFSAFGLEETWVTSDMMAMLETYLLETRPTPDWPRVRYRAAADDPTSSLASWPPPAGATSTFFLSPPMAAGVDGGLATEAMLGTTWTWKSDPARTDPCAAPTDTWFTSAPLTEDLTVVGAPRLSLSLTADAPDFDVIVTLYDYLAGAEEYAVIGAGSVRARYRTGTETPVPLGTPFDVDVELTASAHRVPAGHQLTMSVAPSRCGFIENPNHGGPLDAPTPRQVANVDAAMGASGAKLTIPSLP